jgi:hypothetical protein
LKRGEKLMRARMKGRRRGDGGTKNREEEMKARLEGRESRTG